MASFTAQAGILKRELRHSSDGLRGALDEAQVHELCRLVGHRWRDCFWRPAVVILTFLRQVLLPQCSCRQAVAFTIAEHFWSGKQSGDDQRFGNQRFGGSDRARRGDRRIDDDPSAYSQARQRLPLGLFERLAQALSQRLQPTDARWLGHRVRIVDGSSISMPDTAGLQQVFPQPAMQRKGCGFPVARLLAVFCWHSGAWLRMQIDSLHVSELTLFRRTLDLFEPSDVALADRLFGNYVELSLLQARGVHAVCRVNRARRVDFRNGRRLGANDRLVVWTRPDPAALARMVELNEPLPESLTLRLVRVRVQCRRAWRSKTIDLVTTLLDSRRYPPESLVELYRQRWLAELDLRSMKTTLGMDVLRCKSPEMVRKELRMFQIVYNLIRMLMLQAGELHDIHPHRLSFAGTRQRLLALLPHWPTAAAANRGTAENRLIAALLHAIAADPLPDRPDRHEPRAVKRRRKSFPYLVHPRHAARNTAHYDKRTNR